MNAILQSNIFSFVTAVAIDFIAVLLIVVLVYVVLILRDVKKISKTVSDSAASASEEMKHVIETLGSWALFIPNPLKKLLGINLIKKHGKK